MRASSPKKLPEKIDKQMSSGFNTDVRLGEHVYHVQTEDRGPSRPSIDTAIYDQGRVLLRRSSSYAEFVGTSEFTDEILRQRVEQQHRTIIEELRSGALTAELAAAAEQQAGAGIQVELLNPKTWLSAGTVSLDLEILRRTDHQPQIGARVEAMIEGSVENLRHQGTTDDRGRVQIHFPLPLLGKGDLTLVIHATGEAGKDLVRFTMRSRQKPAAAGSVSTSQEISD
jgi:hypothetical protein